MSKKIYRISDPEDYAALRMLVAMGVKLDWRWTTMLDFRPYIWDEVDKVDKYWEFRIRE